MVFGEEEDAEELPAVVEVGGGVFFFSPCGQKVLGYDQTQHGKGGVYCSATRAKKNTLIQDLSPMVQHQTAARVSNDVGQEQNKQQQISQVGKTLENVQCSPGRWVVPVSVFSRF